jgi:hypothetical protein
MEAFLPYLMVAIWVVTFIAGIVTNIRKEIAKAKAATSERG